MLCFPKSVSVTMTKTIGGGDFLDWASQDIAFTVHLGSHPPFQVVPSPGLRAHLWRALFSPSTQVEPYSWHKVWIDPAKHRLQSYPVSRLRAFLGGMYGTIGHQSPLDWPAVEVLGRAGLSQVPAGAGAFGTFVPGASWGEVLASIDHLYDRRVGAVPPEATTTPAQEIALARVFLAPFETHRAPETKPEAKFRPHPQPPAFEFHQAASLLGNHPPLARLLGLVFDLEFPRPAGLPATYPVSVEASWEPHLKTSNLSPKTMASGLSFRPAERPIDPELAGGYARVGGPEYTVVEVDVDGATTKAVNLAESTRNALAHRAADTPSSYALPSLRSAGLSLARGGNAYALVKGAGCSRPTRSTPSWSPLHRLSFMPRMSPGVTGWTCGTTFPTRGIAFVPAWPPRAPAATWWAARPAPYPCRLVSTP